MPEETPKRPRRQRGPQLVGASRLRHQRQDADEASSSGDAGLGPAGSTGTPSSSAGARRPPSRRPLPSWQRMLVDLVRPSKAQAVLALVLCLCAMATVWQVRDRAADQTYSQMRRTELVTLLDQLNTNSGQLRRELDDLQTAKQQLQTGVNSQRVAQEQARQRTQELSILAGTAPAQGPGITIHISDPESKVGHELLLDAIEEMRDAGAEAIEVNGVRVVGRTWFGSGPDGLLVDGQVIEAPYRVVVLGDPQTLEEGARFRGGLVTQAQAPQVGAVVTITRSSRLTIESLHTPRAPQFARPA